MRNDKLLTCLVSFLLAGVIVFNCNVYRRVVSANPALAIPIVVEGSEVIVTVGAAAVAAIAGIIAGMGIESATQDSTEDLVTDWIQYDVNTNGWEHTQSMLEDTGFSVVEDYSEETGESTASVDVPEHKAGSWTVNSDGTYSNLKWFDKENLQYGSSPEPDNNGNRRLSGFLAGVTGLTTIGASLYDYLHNSDSVAYDAGFTAELTAFSGLASYVHSFVHSTMCSVGFTYFTADCTGTCIGGTCLPAWISDYKYADLYYLAFPKDGHSDVNSKYYAYGFFLVITYSSTSDDSVRVFTVFNKGYGDSGFYPNNINYKDLSYDDAFARSYSFGGVANYQISDLNHVAHFANSDITDDVDAVTGAASIAIGDTKFNLADNNIYRNQDLLQDKTVDAINDDGQVIVTAPAYTTDGAIVVESDSEPTAITNPFLNPDIELNNNISDDTMQGDSILELLKSFFYNFFDKLAQTLKGLFVLDADFLPDWKDKFEAEFVAKGYDFDFDWLKNGNTKQIPDFYIKWGGKSSDIIPDVKH